MPDGNVAQEGVQGGFVKDLGDQSHVLVNADPAAVAGGDARGFLSAVLQRIQTVIGKLRYLFAGGPDAEDSAGILRSFFAGHEIVGKHSVTACHGSHSLTPAGFNRLRDGALRGGRSARATGLVVSCLNHCMLGTADADAVQDQRGNGAQGHAGQGEHHGEESQHGLAGVLRDSQSPVYAMNSATMKAATAPSAIKGTKRGARRMVISRRSGLCCSEVMPKFYRQ